MTTATTYLNDPQAAAAAYLTAHRAIQAALLPLAPSVTVRAVADGSLSAREPDHDRLLHVLGPAMFRWALWQSVIPPMFKAADVTDLRPEQGADGIRAWCSEPTRNLIIHGPVGTGKTHAAYAVASAVYAPMAATPGHRTPQAWTLPALLDALRPGNPDAEQVWDAVKAAPVLVLDDIGWTRPTEWAVERLWMLTDHRMTNDLHTIATTNASAAALEETWGEATLDRLRDQAAIVKMEGVSLRRKSW